MAVQRFEELNNLKGYAEKYYSEFDFSEVEKKKRIALCMEFADLMLLLFYMITEQELEDDEYLAFLEERLRIIASNYLRVENLAFINDWSKKQAKSILETTEKLYQEEIDDVEEEDDEEQEVKHFEDFDVDIPKKDYPTSPFRSLLLAMECVTSVSNYADYYDAVNRGCKRKVWTCTHRPRSRESHEEAESQDIGINDLFDINGSKMMLPGDLTYDPDMKEIYGCRCYCRFY